MQTSLIYTSDRHSAFTDLIFYQGYWLCGFREASTHMSQDGELVILSSSDCKNWQEFARFEWAGGDLRDPKFSIRPDGKLLLTTGVRWLISNNPQIRLYSVAWLFDGVAWSQAEFSAESAGKWRWGTSWHKNKAYSVSYGNLDSTGALYSSLDGLNWDLVQKPFFPNPKIYSNESSLCFVEDEAFCIVRRDKRGGATGLLGRGLEVCKPALVESEADCSFVDWDWKELPISVGAPKLLRLSNGEFIVGGRYINYKRMTAKMNIYKLDVVRAKLKLWRTLPSAGDCSYSGMLERDGVLFVSYYSSHEYSNSGIYLTQIPLVTKPRSQKFA